MCDIYIVICHILTYWRQVYIFVRVFPNTFYDNNRAAKFLQISGLQPCECRLMGIIGDQFRALMKPLKHRSKMVLRELREAIILGLINPKHVSLSDSHWKKIEPAITECRIKTIQRFYSFLEACLYIYKHTYKKSKTSV